MLVDILFESIIELFIYKFKSHYMYKEALSKEPKKVSVSAKKRRFFTLLVPIIEEVYGEEMQRYQEVVYDIYSGENAQKIKELKKIYHVHTDAELLAALKPVPKSIALAQAAVESAWGSSRFFKEANNIFGMWSASSKDMRIAAGKKRGERIIWLKKFPSLKESVRAYYMTLSRAKQYKKLRQLNFAGGDVFEIIQGLENYSEKKQEYVEILRSVIEYNKLLRYDN